MALPVVPRQMLPPPTTTGDLHAHRDDLLDLVARSAQNIDVDAVTLVPRQRFPAQFQHDLRYFGLAATRCVAPLTIH